MANDQEMEVKSTDPGFPSADQVAFENGNLHYNKECYQYLARICTGIVLKIVLFGQKTILIQQQQQKILTGFSGKDFFKTIKFKHSLNFALIYELLCFLGEKKSRKANIKFQS